MNTAKQMINRSVLVAGAKVLDLFVSNDPNLVTVGDARKVAFEILPLDKMNEFRAYCESPSEFIINEDVSSK